MKLLDEEGRHIRITSKSSTDHREPPGLPETIDYRQDFQRPWTISRPSRDKRRPPDLLQTTEHLHNFYRQLEDIQDFCNHYKTSRSSIGIGSHPGLLQPGLLQPLEDLQVFYSHQKTFRSSRGNKRSACRLEAIKIFRSSTGNKRYSVLL